MQGGVEADQVAERERSHRGGAAVDDRRVGARAVRAELVRVRVRLAERPHEDPVHEESGALHHAHRHLAEARRDRDALLDDGVARVLAADDLDEPHHAGRVEEVQAEHPLRPGGLAGERRDRQPRGVRGEDGARRGGGVDAPPQVALELEDLGGDLDDHVARADRGEVRRAVYACEDRLGLGRLHATPIDAPRPDRPDVLDAARHRRVVDVDEHHVAPRRRGDLCDLAPHDAGADHPDRFESHSRLPRWRAAAGNARNWAKSRCPG